MTIRDLLRRGARSPSDARRWYRVARGRRHRGAPRVFYGVDRLPRLVEPAHGGMIKFQALADAFPNETRDFNILYLGSSTLPPDARLLIRLARRRGAGFAWNQDGVAYPGWHGPGWERVNHPLARALHAADHVLYQSDFCKLSADAFLGPRSGPSEILHNPVDTERFVPADDGPARPTLLLGGNQSQRYRFATAVATLALLPQEWRLLVSGRVAWEGDERRSRREAEAMLVGHSVADRVELIGRYTQAEAPAVMKRSTLLLHTKYNDPCPTVVLEAMSAGLPVVYSHSGGTPELVGDEAGIGVEAPLDWERDHPPDPEALAAAVLAVSARQGAFAAAARARALRFDMRPWVARHRVLFTELAG
jgi:glycosyltransferase involved in cell wall biosynthesis